MHLDEITLIRIQRVDRFCRAVLQGSTKLKQHVGLLHEGSQVHDAEFTKVRWNPLFHWLELSPGRDMWLRWEAKEWTHRKYEIITLNPRTSVMCMAMDAVNSPPSSRYDVHNISATFPPVKYMRMVISTRFSSSGATMCTVSVTVERAEGMTIADVLRTWVKYRETSERFISGVDITYPTYPRYD